jgi:hypothetical protein
MWVLGSCAASTTLNCPFLQPQGAPATRTPSDRLLNLSQLVEDGKNEAEKTSTSQTDGQVTPASCSAHCFTFWKQPRKCTWEKGQCSCGVAA